MNRSTSTVEEMRHDAPASRMQSRQLVLVADSNTHVQRQFAHELEQRGFVPLRCRNRTELRNQVRTGALAAVVTELRLSDGPAIDTIEWIRSSYPEVLVIVATSHPSIATAVRCTRLGVLDYFTHPVQVEEVLEALLHRRSALGRVPAQVPENPARLDRAIWEYIHRVVDWEGSIANAASALGLDRRSLRRMLTKYAPR